MFCVLRYRRHPTSSSTKQRYYNLCLWRCCASPWNRFRSRWYSQAVTAKTRTMKSNACKKMEVTVYLIAIIVTVRREITLGKTPSSALYAQTVGSLAGLTMNTTRSHCFPARRRMGRNTQHARRMNAKPYSSSFRSVRSVSTDIA